MSEKQPKKLIKTQKSIENLIILMKKHQVDSIEIEGVKISISKHEPRPSTKPEKAQFEIDEELEFWNMAPQ